MFGYIKPLTGELKVSDHLLYKSIYCGLCRCTGRAVCRSSRLSLSYDVVFLALIRYLLEGKKPEPTCERCVVSPFKKKSVAKDDEVLKYCSSAGALLTYHKLDDDVRDSGGLKKLGPAVLRFFASGMRKKAKAPELDGLISNGLLKLSELEKSSEASPDTCADVFGELLGGIFSYGLDGNSSRISREIGFHTGRWIYLTDAADDFEKDRKRREFNPFGEKPDCESLRTSLNFELTAVGNALELITDGDSLSRITQNIVYLGLPDVAENIIKKLNGVNDDRSI